MSKLSSKPTLSVREALDELLRQSEQAGGKEVGDMFLGPDIFVAILRRRRVVEGEWENTDRTVDLMDLMAEFDSEVSKRSAASNRTDQDSQFHTSPPLQT
jgi:hypothetical protein